METPNNNPTLRQPPAATSAERAVLESVLRNRDALTPIASWLKADDFYDERNAWIYAAMLACAARREPPDLITVAEELRRRGQLEQLGGYSYLVSLSDDVPSSYHVEAYARPIEATAVRRRVIEAATVLLRLAYDETSDIETFAADAQARMTLALARKSDVVRSGLVSIEQVMNELYESLGAEDDGQQALSTGLRDVDELLGGLWRGDLVLVAGRPGHGKTSLLKTIAHCVATEGAPVLWYSLEVRRRKVGMGLVALETGVPMNELKKGSLNEYDLAHVMGALGRLSPLPIRLNHDRVSIADIREQALRYASEHQPPGLILVDYLQLVQASSARRTSTRELEVSEVARGLKNLAMELDVPVIAASQLSREIEHRASPIPTLSDLRESGEQEQAADIVAFIVRPELFDRDNTEKKGIGELHVAKNRDGLTGVVPLRFDGARTMFCDLTYRVVEGYDHAA